MSRGNLVPKQIVNAKGVQTTVYVNPEQSQNLESNPLRGLGAPQSVSRDAEDAPEDGNNVPAGLYSSGSAGFSNMDWHRNRQVIDEAGLRDLPEGAAQDAKDTVLKWGEEWRDRNRVHYVGVEDDTTSLPQWMMNKGLEATASARDRGDSQEEKVWEGYTANLVKRATQSRDLTIKDAKTGLKAAWRRRFPRTFQGIPLSTSQDTDVITSDARHVGGTMVEIEGKQYDLASETWEAKNMVWTKPHPVGEAFL